MAELFLSLLGPVRVALDNQPTAFRTRKTEALLLYLATEALARRETLLNLLWGDYPERSARQSLRTTLSYLKRALPEVSARDTNDLVPFVLSDHQTVRLNPEAAFECDLTAFSGLLREVGDHPHNDLSLCDDCLDKLHRAADLYRGDFLQDFYLPDSSQFEDWASVRREEFRRHALFALDSLAAAQLARRQYDLAEGYARRQLQLDDLRESAHRQLMRALALNGRRSAALSHYETCQQLLRDELGIEPSSETQLLFDAIVAGQLDQGVERPRREAAIAPAPTSSPPDIPALLPSFLDDGPELAEVKREVFVARERELAQLNEQLEAALSGQGRVVFISGDAGHGKTALMQQFALQAHATHADLIVASGNCNAFAGVGDPYLPFREVMAMLSGDVQAHLAARTITRDQALRLWCLLPLVSQAMVMDGPNLLDVFVSGNAMLDRATLAAPTGVEWPEQLTELIRSKHRSTVDLEQRYLFDQFTNVLIRLATQHPLVITLDDLQWADAASISLLFHLGRRLKGTRILIVAAYRPAEVALGLDRERHPLEKLLAEFKRTFGEAWVRLAQPEKVEGQGFVDALLDMEANRLGTKFRQALFRKTGGHPLFTIELLRAMQARGELLQDEQGQWVEGPVLDWQRLPARIEGVLEERFGRLEADLRDVLAVASVEGESFTAEVVARVQGVNLRQLLHQLSQELETRHRLVWERPGIKAGRHTLSRYQFSHNLFQQYLYHSLSAGERRILHGEIAHALEAVYEENTGEVENELARHFNEAGEVGKAVEYARRAAQSAHASYAYEEGVQHLQAALNLLESDGEIGVRLLLLEELADAHGQLRNDVQAVSLYRSALGRWQSLDGGDKMIAVRLHRKILQAVWSMAYYVEYDQFEAMSELWDESRSYLESNLDLIEDEGPQLEAVHVLTALANDAGIRSPVAWDAAERFAEAAVNLAGQLEAPVELGDALQVLAVVHFARGNLLGQLQLLRQALGLSRDPRFGDVRRRINVLIDLSLALMLAGEYGQTIPHLSEAESLALEIGAVDRHVQVLNVLAQCYFRLDRWDELFRVDERRRDLEQRYPPDQIGPSCLEIAFAAAARALQGDLDQAKALREQAYDIMVNRVGGSPANWSRIHHY